MQRLLKPSGTIWVIGSYHIILELVTLCKIWNSGPLMILSGQKPIQCLIFVEEDLQTHETIIWAAKDKKSRYKFNYDAMKSLNDDIQMRSDWHIPICNGKERLRDNDGTKLHSNTKA